MFQPAATQHLPIIEAKNQDECREIRGRIPGVSASGGNFPCATSRTLEGILSHFSGATVGRYVGNIIGLKCLKI